MEKVLGKSYNHKEHPESISIYSKTIVQKTLRLGCCQCSFVFAFMSMIGAWASYHVAEIRSETSSDSLCTHTTRFLPTLAKYETGRYFSVNKEDRC